MPYAETTWYCNSVAYAAVTPFAISTAYTAGQIRRQLTTPTVGNERCFVVTIAGTSAASEPAWVLTRGAKTISNTVTFMECTGQAALNGDATNTMTWTQFKAAAFTPSLGVIIKRNNGASYQIVTTAGVAGASEPAFSDTAGTTTVDSTITWTSLGPVGGFTGGMAPFARLASLCATNWFAVGNTAYISSNHAETQSTALAISPAVGVTQPVGKFLCHNVSGSYPPTSSDLTTGATISTTGNSNITIAPSGYSYHYFYGITFKAGVGASGAAFINVSPNHGWAVFDNCSFWSETTSASNFLQIGTASSQIAAITFNNCTVKFGNVAQFISPSNAQFLWQGTGPILVSGSAVPTTLIKSTGTVGLINNVVLEALDLSQCSGALFSYGTQASVGGMIVRDCKLHASATVTLPMASFQVVQLARSSS